MVDAQGKLSAIGIWRQVVLQQLPGVHPRAHLVMLTSGRRDEVGEHRISLTLRDPEGTVTLEHNGMMTLGEPPPGIDELEGPGILVMDLPLAMPGPHAIVVTIDGSEVARVPFMVGVAVPQQRGPVH